MTTPIIFDCDTGIDDALAMLYGAGQGAEFVACTVSHGNVPVEVGTGNTLTILDALGLHHVPVYSGASRPLAQPLITAEHVHGHDGLGNAGLPPSNRCASGDLAAEKIVRLARENPGDLVLVAVAPLTNIALALLLEPRLPQLVRRVVVMGGAVGVPGNASELGEANIWHDPEAAQLVLDAPWDVLFVGLETTMQTPLTSQSLERIAASADPRAQLAWSVMRHYMDYYTGALGFRSCILHDPLAMALALDPNLARYRTMEAFVEVGRGRTRGALVGEMRASRVAPQDPAAPGVIRIVASLDTDTFHRRFLESLGA